MKGFVYRKTIKILKSCDFSMHESTNFSHILSNNKKTNMETLQFYLSFRKGMLNTTKYSRCRKMAIF